MAFLGFSAGLPFVLIGATLSAWLRASGVDLAAIGFLSWVGLAYSIKVLWAPVVDRVPLPWLTRVLGRRRAWMLFAQLVIAASLASMASGDPRTDVFTVTLFAVVVAFASATQDIAVDAYRIEAVTADRQGAMATAYVFGYRMAMIVATAGALHIARLATFETAYGVMAALALVGIATTLIIAEPEVNVAPIVEAGAPIGWARRAMAWFVTAVVSPFADFFARFGSSAVLILAFVGAYRLSDIVMGTMSNPFYLDLGFSIAEIANIASAFGLAMTLAGAALGGMLVVRFGITPVLLFTVVMAPATNLIFSWLAVSGPDRSGLILAIIADNVTSGMAYPVLIAYISSLTSRSYTATQYALLSSLMTLPGQLIGGFTGLLAARVGWFWFFICAAVLGLPAIVLAVLLPRRPGASSARS